MFANRESLGSVVSFVDQRFEWPERIAIDAALDAEKMGAFIRNFTNVGSLVRRGDNLCQAELTNVPDDRQKITAQARLVLDLAGAWVDEVIGRVGGAGTIEKKIVCLASKAVPGWSLTAAPAWLSHDPRGPQLLH